MRTKIKQETTIIALLILCTIFLSCMGGCTKKEEEWYYFDTEYFKCVSHGKYSETTAIIGLMDKGKEKKIIVFPEKLNGYNVDQIGCSFYDSGLIHKSPITYTVDVSTIKKMYILSKLNDRYDVRMEKFRDDCQIILFSGEAACFWSSVFPRYHVEKSVSPSIFVSDTYLTENQQFLSNRRYKDNTFGANIRYYYNSGDETLYFIDAYNEHNLYALPESPIRDGYIFSGWYLEKECTNIWSRVYPDGQDEVLNLYAKWDLEKEK